MWLSGYAPLGSIPSMEKINKKNSLRNSFALAWSRRRQIGGALP